MNGILHIVVAAGSGSRFCSELPKQFHLLGGRPVVMEAIDRLRRYGRGGRVVVVLSSDFMERWVEMCREYGFDSPPTVAGGATRFESVRNAIEAFGSEARIITAHDGARPCVSAEVVAGVLDAVEGGAEAAIPAVAVTDSLRYVDADGRNEAVDRSQFRAVQTPQGFRGATLREAYAAGYRPEFTDDASVAEACGAHVVLTPGSPYNIKITHPADLAVAELFLKEIS